MENLAVPILLLPIPISKIHELFFVYIIDQPLAAQASRSTKAKIRIKNTIASRCGLLCMLCFDPRKMIFSMMTVVYKVSIKAVSPLLTIKFLIGV